ncbi:hypothetical protein PanWU01x14_078080 [Parasponia andersonii]|uniref:Uncharacterized protein n=1 Tax=Parasponia andersonii TaxID=3476 RepID=A0A2P5DBY2_PARAD|nr:hypothetical protein PanWU01x14_078080 [Parasponia andersonii]
MPPPRCNTTISDQNSGPATRIPPTTQVLRLAFRLLLSSQVTPHGSIRLCHVTAEGSCHMAAEGSCHVLVVVPCGCTRSCQVATLDCDTCLLVMLPCHHCNELHVDATSDYTSAATSESMSIEPSHVGGAPVNITYT